MTERPLTVGTAGHIDHGKTALIAALTGVDTDRLPQEKARGISIELGYAPLVLPSGRRLSVVDVPGHERFVRTMVAGVTGIDLFLLVIACDDGVMPQTREHVAILRMLGLERGVIALTKRDLVDEETAELVRLEAEELLPGIPAVHVSPRTGAGLDQLRTLLDETAAAAEHRSAEGPVRLPVDRSFSLRGIGTVVTGTLWSGTLRTGDRLVLEPGGRDARVRSVEVHDQPVEAAGAGQRVAVALVGVERRQVGRGDTLATPGSLRATYRLECEVTVLPDAPHGLRHAERVTVHLATSETAAKVAVRGGDEIGPGATGTVQLRLARPVAANAGDRVILRLTAPQTTLAGGRVLDTEPTRSGAARPAAVEAPARAPARALSDAGADDLEQRLAESPFAPPALSAADQAPAAYLADAGRIVRAGRDLAFTRATFDLAQAAAIEIATERGAVTIAQLRDRLGCSRRYAQALLEAMDAGGVTRRVGDERILRRRARTAAGGSDDAAAG
jgi:selenocysteine-specific elongation factor